MTLMVLSGLGSGCVARSPRALMPLAAEAVLSRLEEAVTRRDYVVAHALVNYRYRLSEVLADLWSAGSDEAQESLVSQSQAMFEDTSERLREHFAGLALHHVVKRRDGPHLWVDSVPAGAKAAFAWSYRLTASEETWTITQREYRVSGTPSDSTRFWPMARKQIAARFGRPITLEELAANLPSVMGTMRVRAIRVPELPRPQPEATP
jgi:hypothetical protein